MQDLSRRADFPACHPFGRAQQSITLWTIPQYTGFVKHFPTAYCVSSLCIWGKNNLYSLSYAKIILTCGFLYNKTVNRNSSSSIWTLTTAYPALKVIQEPETVCIFAHPRGKCRTAAAWKYAVRARAQEVIQRQASIIINSSLGNIMISGYNVLTC